jgi:hypothetical protein
MSLTKAALLKIKPGTVIEISWKDVPSEFVILTEPFTAGNMEARALNSKMKLWYIEPKQVLSVHGPVCFFKANESQPSYL